MNWDVIYKSLLGVAIVLAIVVIVALFVPKFRTFQDYQKKRQEDQQENRRLQTTISELVQKQEQMMSDPAFVEKTARDAGMVKENEIIFKYDDGTTAGSTRQRNAP